MGNDNNNGKARADKIRRIYNRTTSTVSMLSALFGLSKDAVRKILRNETHYDDKYSPARQIELRDVLEELIELKQEAEISNAKASQIIASRYGRKPWAESTIRAAIRRAIENGET